MARLPILWIPLLVLSSLLFGGRTTAQLSRSETRTSLLAFLKNRSDTSSLVEWIETPHGFATAFDHLVGGEWKFTFFAPNNDALGSLNKPYHDWLISPLGHDTIGNILVHHYVPYTNFNLTSFNETYGHFQTATFLYVGAQMVNGVLVLNRAAKVVEGPIEVDSGVVYIVDRVLSPSYQEWESENITHIPQTFIPGSCSNPALPYC